MYFVVIWEKQIDRVIGHRTVHHLSGENVSSYRRETFQILNTSVLIIVNHRKHIHRIQLCIILSFEQCIKNKIPLKLYKSHCLKSHE